MRRAAIVVVLGGCTPAADTVGAWTTDGGADDPESSSSLPFDASSSSSPSGASSDESTTTTSSSTSETSTSTGAIAPPPWVATVGADLALRALDLDDGVVVDVCTLDGVSEPDGLAFLPDGRLVGSRADSASLWVADPCDCTVTPIVPPDAVALHALAERNDEPAAVVGVDALRAGLFEVTVDGASLVPSAELADAGAIQAIAAMPDSDDLWALVDAGGPRLQRIDLTGVVTQDEPLAIPADASGLTLDPDGASLLACDAEGALWRIDADDGASSPLAVAAPDSCRTLATPHGTIGCIDALFGE